MRIFFFKSFSRLILSLRIGISFSRHCSSLSKSSASFSDISANFSKYRNSFSSYLFLFQQESLLDVVFFVLLQKVFVQLIERNHLVVVPVLLCLFLSVSIVSSFSTW
eukprot:UN14647